MRRVPLLLLVLAFAANSGHTGWAAADPATPGAEGCTALGAGVVPGLATIRTTYDGGSAAWSPWGEPLAPIAADPVVVNVDPATVAAVRTKYPFLDDMHAD